jgi:hypothetical protein
MKKNILIQFLIPFVLIILFLLGRNYVKTSQQDRYLLAKDEFIKYLNQNVIEITIYCGHNTNEKDYKIIISDKNTIYEIVENSKKIYQKDNFEGYYNHTYYISMRTVTDEIYTFMYYKKHTIKNASCMRYLEHDNFKEENPFGDCGQLVLLKNIHVTEDEIRCFPITGRMMIFQNISLIPLLEKYADDIELTRQQKERFHFYHELSGYEKRLSNCNK